MTDSVQQRTGNALQIALNGIGRAAARAGGVPKIAAWAGIHGGDNHNGAGIGKAAVCPGNRNFPVFHRLAEHFK